MISGPEVSHTVKEFDSSFLPNLDNDDCYHEQLLSSPFLEDSPNLLVLDTKDIMSEPVITTMRDALQISQKQYDAYIKGHLEGSTKAVSDTISRNKLPLFVCPKERMIVHFMPDERW